MNKRTNENPTPALTDLIESALTARATDKARSIHPGITVQVYVSKLGETKLKFTADDVPPSIEATARHAITRFIEGFHEGLIEGMRVSGIVNARMQGALNPSSPAADTSAGNAL